MEVAEKSGPDKMRPYFVTLLGELRLRTHQRFPRLHSSSAIWESNRLLASCNAIAARCHRKVKNERQTGRENVHKGKENSKTNCTDKMQERGKEIYREM